MQRGVSALYWGVICKDLPQWSLIRPNASTGEFSLARLAPGNYDVVITAADHTAAVVGAVPMVSTSSTVALSTAAAPITLATGTMSSIAGVVTLTPPSTTTTPGTGKHKVDASATGYARKSAASVDVTVASVPAINFALLP